MKTFTKLLLHVPHASIEGLTNREISGWELSPKFINEAVLRQTDLFTDVIFRA